MFSSGTQGQQQPVVKSYVMQQNEMEISKEKPHTISTSSGGPGCLLKTPESEAVPDDIRRNASRRGTRSQLHNQREW